MSISIETELEAIAALATLKEAEARVAEMNKEAALERLQRQVTAMRATLDCCHGMLEALLAANGIEVVEGEVENQPLSL